MMYLSLKASVIEKYWFEHEKEGISNQDSLEHSSQQKPENSVTVFPSLDKLKHIEIHKIYAYIQLGLMLIKKDFLEDYQIRLELKY